MIRLGLAGRAALGSAVLAGAGVALGWWWAARGLDGGVALVGLAAVVVAAGAGWFAGRRLTGRLASIARFAERVPQGGAPRLSAAVADEFGALAVALNEMAERISRRIGAVAEDRTRFEAVLAAMVEGVMVLDHSGRILLINAAMERILACRADEVTGHKWIEVIRDHGLGELIGRVLKHGEATAGHIVLGEAGGQRAYSVQASVAPRDRGARDEGFRAVFVFHDVTALRRLERVRSDFVANVSHELRTPLTSIAGYLEALLDGAQHDAAQRDEFLRVVKTHADRLNALVNDLLQLSQIESGAYRWRRDEIDVERLANRAMALIRPLAQKKRVALTYTGGTSAYRLVGDDEKLTQVLLNLLDNAVKYTGDGGAVDLQINQRDGMIFIRVSDTGIGIPETDRRRIFERFYRVDRGRSRELGGTGLGLSIVKHIVEAHRGSVTVESRLGKGSIFTVSLPTATDVHELPGPNHPV